MVTEQVTIDLASLHLAVGEHDERDEGVCLLEAVAWFAGQEHTDHPPCVCPVIAVFGRSWNDSLDDQTRQRLIPYIPRMVGTADDLSERRAWLCLDWLSRECAPAFLELSPALKPLADALRVVPEICDQDSLAKARPELAAA